MEYWWWTCSHRSLYRFDWPTSSLFPSHGGDVDRFSEIFFDPFASQICLFKTVPYQTNALVCSPATCISSLFPGLVMVAMVATLPRRIPGVDRKTDLKMGSFTRVCSSVRVKTPSADKVIPLNIWETCRAWKLEPWISWGSFWLTLIAWTAVVKFDGKSGTQLWIFSV